MYMYAIVHTLTTEPHDKLHPATNLDGSEAIHYKSEGENICCPSNQDQNETPNNELHFKRRGDGEQLHTNVKEHHSLCVDMDDTKQN